MLPEDGQLSTTPVPSSFVDGGRMRGNLKMDLELGGIALNDPSQGLLYQMWTAEYTGGNVVVSAPSVATTLLFSRPDIESISLGFDQNMRPAIAFMQAGQAWLWWYDTNVNTQVFTQLDPGITSIACCTDEKRQTQTDVSDIIVAYIRAGSLYYRQQRDRFQIEYLLYANCGGRIIEVGMNRKLRLQFLLKDANTASGLPDSPFLADVLLDLCEQADIFGLNVDVDELYVDRVQGLKVDNDDGLAEPVDQLRQVFFFDKAEYDKKIHFVKRGREVVARIPYKDLVRGNPVALKQERQDETDLAREVNVNHLDPDGGFAKNKQFAQRRSNLINAQAKKNVETQVVLTVDQAATTADTLLRIDWNELIEYKFATTIKYTYLTIGDVIEVEDKLGTWHRMRLQERNEDGTIDWEATQDAGQRTYGKTRTGNALPPPTSTTPGLVGETRIEIVNCSPLRDQDDELGVYVAAAGDNSAWTGYQMLISTDNGTSYYEAYRAEAPSTLGETVTDLPHALGYEYQSVQAVEVTCNFPVSSISYEQLLGNLNRIVIGDEVLQFQTATLLGMVGTLYHYRLSGLLRGRYATETLDWPAGTRFVLIDETLVFAQAQRAMLGIDIYYKPVSFGLTEDETVPTAYLFDEPASQTEWPVTLVQATRDGGAVVVNWVGVARLGNDTTPFHSKYFAGYRVKFDNGHTIDTADSMASYAGAPAGVGVQVCALNSITGEGPYSTLIIVP
jgi:hypothetical protein